MLTFDSLQNQALILDLSADSILIHDLDGTIIFANKPAYESRGYEKDEMPGMKLSKILAPEQSGLFTGRIRELFNKGELRFESAHVRKDGSFFPVETHDTLIEIEGNQYCCSVSRDITERKLAKEELFDSRQMLQMVLDNIPQRIFWKDRSSIYLGCNKPLALDCGYADPGELIGKTDYETASAANADIYRADDRMVMETGLSKINYEEPQIKPDGSSAWLRTSKVPLLDKNGRVIGVLGMYEDITNRKLMEESLRLSEAELKEAQNIARLGRWELNLVKNSLQWSDTIFEIFEIDQTQFGATYEAFLQAIHPDDREMVNRTYTDSLKQKHPYAIMHRLLMKDGRVKWVIEMCQTDYNLQGQAIRSVGIVQDITALKQAEEAIGKSRETLEKTFRSMDSALFILDNSTPPVITECNPAGIRIFGYEKEEMLGRTTEFLHVDTESLSEFQKKNYAAIKEAGFLSSLEFRMKRRNGEIFTTEHSVFPLLDDRGSRVGWVSVVKDITERRRAEQQTRDALNFIRTMMESSPIGIVSIKATGTVVAANQAIARISGGTVDQLLKQNVRNVEAWKKYGLLSTMDEAVATATERWIETDYVSTFGKHLWLSVRFVPYTFEGEPHVLALLTDRSDQKRDEAEKEKLQDQLLQAQKMEAVGQLAGGIAHDFNNILSAIVGYGNIALMKMTRDDPQRLNIEHMLAAGDRAAHLTRDLLLFSRKHISERKPADLNDIIRNVENFLTRVIGEDIDCKTILSNEQLTILGDDHQLEQVLMNLATNARDAMPKGGVFTVTTNQVKLDAEYVSVHGYGKTGNYVMMIISDTGKGMDEVTREHIFEPFFTTKDVGKGTGLGLAVVYGIIKQHEGFINVYSEPGRGTIFKIYLPLITSGADTVKKTTEERLVGGNETILLAEDDETVRAMTKTVLEQFGYTVIAAIDGLDAVNKYKENKGKINLLLFDIIMPKKTGKEAYNEIFAMTPKVKVLFASGYAPDEVRQRVLIDERMPLVSKPISPNELLKKVRETLDR